MQYFVCAHFTFIHMASSTRKARLSQNSTFTFIGSGSWASPNETSDQNLWISLHWLACQNITLHETLNRADLLLLQMINHE